MWVPPTASLTHLEDRPFESQMKMAANIKPSGLTSLSRGIVSDCRLCANPWTPTNLALMTHEPSFPVTRVRLSFSAQIREAAGLGPHESSLPVNKLGQTVFLFLSVNERNSTSFEDSRMYPTFQITTAAAVTDQESEPRHSRLVIGSQDQLVG